MSRSIISEALTAATDNAGFTVDLAGGVDVFFIRPVDSAITYRVRAIDDETTLEIEPVDAHGYGLGEDCIRLTNPSTQLLAAILSSLTN